MTADLVVVGIGVAPNVELAEAAGLETDNGILVDEHLGTSDPDVFAAGDVANALHPVLGRRLRVEHWDTAIEQGKTAAHAMLGHAPTYDRLPYFFTDQYDLGMEYIGSVGPDGYDEVVLRGDTTADGGRTFTAFWLKGDRVLAGMHVNDWDATDHLRAIVGRDRAVRLRDESPSLADLAQGAGTWARSWGRDRGVALPGVARRLLPEGPGTAARAGVRRVPAHLDRDQWLLLLAAAAVVVRLLARRDARRLRVLGQGRRAT